MKNIQYNILFLIVLLFSLVYESKGQENTTLAFTIDPIETLSQFQDIYIKPSSGTASSSQSGEGIERTWDRNMSTLYHSSYSNTTFPVTLRYNFASTVEKIDYFVYHPRSSGSNGNFKEIEVFYKLQGQEEVKYGDFDFEGSNNASIVNFSNSLVKPEYIKIKVNSGAGDGKGFASCAEMEFYQANKGSLDLSEFFVDDVYSAIKPGVTKEQILNNPDIPVFFKYLALEQSKGYSPYRTQSYEAYRPVGNLSKELKTSNYNQYENPTGILLEGGKKIVIFVSDTKGEVVSLKYRNWATGVTGSYALKSGINYISAPQSADMAQTYISYYTNNYETAQPIKIHIFGGLVNRVFDINKGHTNQDWKEILAAAPGAFLDIVGKYTNLSYRLAELKSYCPSKGVELINVYDEIIKLEYEMMGLVKYNRIPKNHMFARSVDSGLFADGIGAGYYHSSLSTLAAPEKIITGDNSWTIGHEYGHVNQIRPGLKWVGTTEVTNNIYSSYVQYILTKTRSSLFLRLEHENCKDIEDGVNVIGGRFNSHLHYGVLKGDLWQFQWGQDHKIKDNGDYQADHFVKLVPIWQLNLYFKLAENATWKKPDWYADIAEETRETQDANFSEGTHQINFMKRACKYTQTDLTDFFEKAGMLKEINRKVDDYNSGQMVITAAMIQEVKDYVAENKWSKPEGVINYISGNTIEIYEKKLAVEGILNQGVSGSGTFRTVNHNVWKNAVVYRTYQGEEVVRLTMAGTGTTNNSSTRVPYPAGSTKITAISWNGIETTVYQP